VSTRHRPQELPSEERDVGPVTTEMVEKWFATALQPRARRRKFSCPCRARCSEVAQRLNQIPPAFVRTYHPDLAPGPANKHARLLIRHLPAEIERFERLASAVGGGDARIAARMSAGRLSALMDELAEILVILKDMNMRGGDGQRALVGNVAAVAMTAWLGTNGPSPRSLNAEDPIATFVQLALAHLEGFERSQETIASALKASGLGKE
jgi:hypothetical protein